MKKFYLTYLKKFIVSIFVVSLFPAFAFAGSGIFESYIVVETNGGGNTYYDLLATTGNPDFQGTNLGTFTCTNSLIIRGGENKTYKNGTDDILNGYLHYRVYKNGTDPNLATWVSIQLGAVVNLGNGDQSWSSTSGTANILKNPLNGNSLPDGTYIIEAYTSADYNFSGSGTLTHYQNVGGANYKASFTISNPIVVTTQPTTPTVCYGSNTILSAAATGADTYYWQKQNGASWTGVSSGSIASGATTTLNLTNVTTTEVYRCVFTNCGGINELATNPITVTPQRPTISIQPVDAIDCYSNNINYYVGATAGNGGTLTYQWQRKLPSGSYANIDNTTTDITIVNPNYIRVVNIGAPTSSPNNPDGTFFRCIITESPSGCQVTSNEAALGINKFNTISVSKSPLCVGENITFTSSIQYGSSRILSYQWYKTNISTGSISGANNATYSTTIAATADNSWGIQGNFQSNLTLSSGITTPTTCLTNQGRTITVNALPSTPTVTNAARCGTGAITVSASGATTGQNYKWYVDNNPSTTFFQKDLASYSPTLSATTDYYVSIYNTTTLCESARIKVTVTINVIPTITLGTVNAICPSSTAFSLPYSAITGSPNQYSVSVGTPAMSGFSTISDATLSASPLSITVPSSAIPNNYSFAFTVKNSSTGCTSVPQNVALSYLTPTSVTTHYANSQTKCEGESVSFAVSGYGAGTVNYVWKKNGTAIVTDSRISIDNSVITSSVLTINNLVNTDADTYTCEVSSTCGTVTSNAGTLIVNPKASFSTQPTNKVVCKNGTTTFSVSAIGTGTLSYRWKKGTTILSDGANISGSSSNSLVLSNLELADAGNYLCEVKGDCDADFVSSNTASLTVNDLPPTPTVTSPIGYCQNATASALSANGTGTLLWYGTSATGGTSSASPPTPITTSAGTFSYYVSQKDGNNCESPRAKIDVEITPTLSGVVSGINAFCITGVLNNSTTLTATPTGGNGTFTYQWQNLSGNIVSETNQTFVTSTANTYKTVITSGYCTATTANFAVTAQGWNDVPNVTGNTPDICGSGSKTLSIVSPNASGTYKWFADATTLTQTSSGTSYTTPSLSSTTTYYVAREQQVTASLTCQTNRTAVTINVITIPPTPTIVNSANKTTFCNNESSFTLSVSCSSGDGQYRLNSGSWIVGNSVSINPATYPLSATFTYDFKCVVSATCESSAASTSITVNPAPAAPSISGNTSFCTGGSTTLTANGCTGTVIWSNGTSASTITVSSAGTYNATCTIGGCVSPASSLQTIVVTSLPSISLEPTDIIACKGNTVHLIVSATNATSYQWQRKKPSDGSFINVDDTMTGISGSTTNDLRLTSVGTQNPDQSLYRCIISNNSCSITSSQALLSVNSFTATLASQTKCENSSVTFSVPTSVGTINSYQWEQRPFTTGFWTPIVNTSGKYAGATTNSLVVSNLSSDEAVYYRCTVVFSTGTGTCNLSTDDAKLTVTTITPPTVSGATAICAGSSTTLTANGCTGTVTWSTGAAGSTVNASIAGTYSATCTQSGCTSLASNVHTLTVNAIPAPPTITSDDADNTVCQGTNIVLTASDCTGTVIWSNGVTANSITVSASGTYNATCTVNSCVSTTSVLQTIIVNAIPNAPSISGSTSICSGNSTTLTANGCSGTVIWSNGVTASTITISSVGTYNATCTVNNCISIASATQTITINSIPNAPTITGNTAVCQGSSTTLTASACAGRITWSTGATGSTINASVGTYSATCTENSCISVASATHTITENLLPTITLSSVNSICNAATTFDLSYTNTANSPDKYSLTSTMPSFVAVNDVSLPSSPISVTIPSGKTGTHIFTLSIKNNTTNCINSQNFNVTILPVLVGGSIETSPSTTNCSGYIPPSISSVALASGGKTAYTYQWQSSTDEINFTDISEANLSGFTPTANLTQTTYFRRKVTDACGAEAFSSNSHQITIVPDPQITITDASDKMICSGNSISLDATLLGGFGTCTPTWQSSNSPSSGFVAEQSGGTTFTKTLTNATSAPIIKYFRVIYACAGTGSGSCNQATSAVVKVTINPLPSVPTISGANTTCAGASTTLTASGCNGNLLWSNGATTTSINVSIAGSYSAVCTNSCGTSAASNEIVVNVTTTTPPTLAGTTSICGGQIVTLTASDCAGTVVWSNGSSGTSINVSPSTTTSYTATCTANGCTSVASNAVIVTVAPTVDFTVGTVADLCNTATSFSLPYSITLGSPDKYSLTSAMVGFVSINDATLLTSPITVTIPNGQTGTFSFTLTQKISATGCSKSQTFVVTILPVLAGGSIEVSPSTTNCAGYTPSSISSVTLASGGKTAYTYQWQNSTDNINFTDISGANLSGFTPPASLTQTTYFRRKVSDACNAETFSSNSHQITIVPDPQITITDASDKTICSGNSISLDATLSGGFGTCTPTWQSSDSPSSGFVAEQSGGTTFTKILTNTTSTPIIKYFRAIYACAGTGSGSCNQATSAVVKVTINYIPEAPIILPASVVICPTQSTTLTASGCVGNVTWAGGQTGSTLLVSTSGSYTATCSVNNCVSVASSPSIVTVASGGTPVSPPTISGTATICNGQFTTLLATGCTGLVTWSDGKTGTSINVNPSISTNYTATCNDGTCTSNVSNEVTVTVNNYPTITTQPKNDADCNGNSVTFSVSASPATAYQWQRKIPNGSFTDITNAISNSLTISNVGSAIDPNLTQYQVTISNATCSVTSTVAVLTVNSVTGSLADQTICEGANITLDLTGITTTGTIQSYQWQKRVGTSGTWNDILGANTTALTINNATNADEQYYRCKINFAVGSSTCARYTTEQDANGAKLTVLVASTPNISGDNAICLGKSTTLTANSCDGTINWSSGQTTSTITVSPTETRAYTVTCASTQCNFTVTSAPYSVVVNTTPQPESITYDVIVPVTLTFRAKTTVPNGTLMWYNRAIGGTGTTTAPVFSAVGNYLYWVTQTDPITGCESARLPVGAKVLNYFHITFQPNTQADCKGNSVNMSVTAVGPVSYFVYQWQRKRPNEPDFINLTQDGNGIKGWNQKTMVVSNVGDEDNPHLTQYRCIINNEGHFITSNPATLSVNSVIGALPNLGTCVGSNFNINLATYFTIIGNVLSYQWQTRPGTSGAWTDVDNGNDISGSTTNELKFAKIGYDKAAYYRCLVKFNTQGLVCTEPTDATRLLVSGYPTVPTVSDIFYCQFAKPTKLKADNSIFDLVWYTQKIDGVGSTTAPTPNTDIVGTVSYYVAEQTDQGCEGPRAEIKVETVALPPAPVNTTPSAVNEGTLLIFSADGSPKEKQILRWFTSPTTTTFSATAPTFTAVGTFTRYVAQISELGCLGPRTAITASIIPNLKFTKQPISQADCDGNSVTFSVTATGPSAFTYQWQRQKPTENVFVNITNETANSLKISNIGDAENPHLTKYRCIIKDEKGSTTSEETILTVNEIKGTLANISLCDGKTAKLSFNSLTITGKVVTYQWQKKEGSIYTDILTNQDGTANANEIGTYRGRIVFAIDSKTTCARNTDDLKIDVKPIPVAPQVANQAICQNATFNLEKSVIASNTILWYDAVTDSTGDKNPPKIDLSKIGKSTFYVSQITQFGCESERKSFDLTISPIPTKPIASDISYCRNAPSIALIATTDKENTLIWYVSNTTKDAFAKTPIPDTKIDGTLNYYVSARNAASCESVRVPLKVTVVPCIATFENNFNNCLQAVADSVKGNKWFDLYDNEGSLYASVNPNGLNLGKVTISVKHYGRGSAAIPATKNETRFMARYIDFQSTLLQNFEKPVSLRIYYQNTELNEYKTAANLLNLTINDFNIVHYDGIREDCGFENNDNFNEGNSVVIYKNVVGNQVTKDFFFLQFDVNEFSENGATANDFTEISFSGKETADKTVNLNWQTKFEIKADKFILERSADCQKWVSLGEIKANGISSNYEKVDNQPLSGKSCYRLIYIDKDGTKKYLDPIEVNFTDTVPICSVFPNPWTTGDEVKLYLRNIKEKEIKLYDLVGQEYSLNWRKDELGIIHIRPDSYLTKGTHFVVIIDNEGKRCVQKVVINP